MLETGPIGAIGPVGEKLRMRGKAALCKALTPALSQRERARKAHPTIA